MVSSNDKRNVMQPIRFLTRPEMARIHQAALRILERTGMTIDHIKALEYLRQAGCCVDMDKRHVLFPSAVVETAVARMKANFADPDRQPKRMSVRYAQVHFGREPFQVHGDFSVSSGGFCCFIWDLEGRRRSATMADVRQALKLADRLDQITYTGLPCAAQEVPVAVRPVVMAAELAKATRKLGGIETFKAKDVEYICRIGEIVAGGKEAHRRNPVLVGYAEARTPLCIDTVMADVMLAHLERGLPQSLDTMPNAGATAPMTAAGTLALGIAETLAGLTLGFAVDPQATLTIDVTPGYCDMRSLRFGYAGAERLPLIAARIQLVSEFYGCPSGVHGGKTNACVPGIQAGVEKAASMLMPVLAGAIGFGTVGHLENALTFSPLQLVIDNEIARYVRRCVQGIEVSDETLALDIIEQAGIGGQTVDTEHTTRHFKHELLLSPFFDVPSWGVGDAQDKERFEKMALDKARRLLAEETEPILSRSQQEAIDEIVAEAKRDYGC
ncbi:MAG: trimethylamine methyltransferase family protein [Kiritimatiellaeota bacterium]|nr:trimethylamine methyltransferase family protein [Kiritimatiellota bacterium]